LRCFHPRTQQLSGQASVLNYAPLIFSKLNHSDLSATLWIGLVKFFITVLVIWRIEYVGRKALLLIGMSMIVIGQFLLAFAFTLVESEQNPPKSAMFWALPGVLCVVFGYSASFGPLTWLLTSELFPTDIRGRALGTSTIVTYFCAWLVTSTFLSMQSAIGAPTVFVIYGSITLLGIAFAYLAIPDTGNKSAEEIDDELKQMWWWRQREPVRDEFDASVANYDDDNVATDRTNLNRKSLQSFQHHTYIVLRTICLYMMYIYIDVHPAGTHNDKTKFFIAFLKEPRLALEVSYVFEKCKNCKSRCSVDRVLSPLD
jgi:MFS family permease